MLIRPAIGDTDPIRYRRPTPDGQFSGNILDEAMRGCRELTRAGVDARAKLRLSVPHLSQQSHRIERAINLSKTPLDGLAQFRVRQCARIGRCRNMITLDYLCAFASLVLQLKGRLEEVGVQPRCSVQTFQHAQTHACRARLACAAPRTLIAP